MDMLKDLQEWQRRFYAAPPVADRIIANYDVPPGKVFRYWDTRGRLWAYVNRGAIEMLPRQKVDLTPNVRVDVIEMGRGAFGIQVFFEGPDLVPIPSHWYNERRD